MDVLSILSAILIFAKFILLVMCFWCGVPVIATLIGYDVKFSIKTNFLRILFVTILLVIALSEMIMSISLFFM